MTDIATCHVLTYDVIESMKTVLQETSCPNDFLAAVDQVIADERSTLEWPVDLGQPDSLSVVGPGSSPDAANAMKVYEFLGPIDRANAADPRLWTYLAFKTFRPYMESRWPLTGAKWKNRVLSRWLLASNVSRGTLVRHGIARLWWVAELTVDFRCQHELSKGSSDPFAYTAAVFKNEDRINALFDREIGAQPQLVRAVLEHAESDLKCGSDQHIRKLLKELTLIYGYRDISSLQEGDIHQIIARAVS